MADSGKLVVVLAGPSAAVDRVTPYCNGMCVDTTQLPLINCCCSETELTSRGNHRIGRATIDLRDREPGMATLLKVTGNTFVFSMVGFIPPSSHHSRPPEDEKFTLHWHTGRDPRGGPRLCRKDRPWIRGSAQIPRGHAPRALRCLFHPDDEW